MNRRIFLRGTASVATLQALGRNHALAAAWPPPAQEIAVYVTSPKQKRVRAAPLAWETTVPTQSAETVTLEAGRTFQPVLGFGAAFTDAACYVLHGMPEAARRRTMADLFTANGLNLSVGRCCVGASDYSRDVFSYDDVPDDTGLTHFSTAHDDAYILPILREARKLQPDLFLLSSTWSPPGWMKVYGSMLGGWMSEKYLDTYARYYVRFLESYAEKGMPIQALTTGNEVEAEQGGSMPATFWPPELEADFIRDHLGPLLRERKLAQQIWLLDHNYDLWKRVAWQMRDPQLASFVAGVAWHGYVGTPDLMTHLHERLPEVPFYWTEGGPNINDAQYALDWTYWGRTFTAALRNWCRCVIGWNLALDPEGKPNIGPFQCGGLVTVTRIGEVRESGHYQAFWHFSHFVQRNAHRIASHSDATDLEHVAFVQPDGSFVVVLTNSGGERTVQLRHGDRGAMIPLPENSLTTLLFA